ncbi:ASCH domain-containing protein [Snuella sedimenti]|uniref:ASCH domain-containing protein n=1 Tax=Snuella sedimenti TaxID=2798802 RepID=A0A8J7J505_9FLAO|nr:ASCH domain-containing protein [Snuella sedimenti]MBJ6368693.1 ASCH domain-containing protein [Snuella sedimenti]
MTKTTHSSAQALWQGFIQNNPEYKNKPLPVVCYFCDNQLDADTCAQLTVEGIKQATSTSLWWFETYKEPLPQNGDLYIITNWNGQAKAIIQTTKVEQVPFKDITPEYAHIEGEGDKSLDYWKKVHWDYYGREMKAKGSEPTEDMIIVCEYFKTVWK